MKNLKKLLVVFFFTVAVSLFAFAISASAEEVKYPVDGGYLYFDSATGAITDSEGYLMALDIPAEINGVEITTIRNWAFDEQYYLQSVNIPAGVKKIEGFAFNNCDNLKSINIPASVKEIGDFAFFECNNLKSITVDDANPYFCDVDGVLFNRDITEIIAFPAAYTYDSYALPKTVTRIGNGAFVHINLGTLDISSVTKLGKAAFINFYINNLYANADVSEYYLYNTDYYYYERSFMTEADYFIGYCKVYNVYFTGDSVGPWKDILRSYGENYICNFEGRIESYPLDSGKIYYNSLTGTITGASGVRNLDIPEEINGTKIVAIADNAFASYVGYQQETECYSFDRVTIPKTIETIGENAFYGAQIDEIVISDGVKLVGNSAFYGLWYDSIDSLIVEDIDNYIGINAVWGSYSIKNLTVRGNVRNIADNAFSKERGLQNLVLEEGIKTIGDGAFSEIGITELVIPRSVKTVEANAFSSCSNLKTLTYYSTTDVDKSAFANCPSLNNINIIEVEYPDPLLSVDGLAITVRNLDGVKDFFIAKGIYNTYRELKPHNIMRIPEAKINGANEYTYTVSQPGDYTVCVRFNDGSENLILYATATADLPEFDINALALTVNGLKDIRVIRIAPGVWNSPAEVKRAEGCRNITANTIGNTDSYTVYYPESGTYTVTLEYTNGLVVVEHIEVNATEPTMVQNGNSVTLGNLDNLYTIRYAKGEYATMGEIKRAEGCQIRRSRDIKNGVITVNDLEAGTYTFCVQYNDQSYNYFTVVVK